MNDKDQWHCHYCLLGDHLIAAHIIGDEQACRSIEAAIMSYRAKCRECAWVDEPQWSSPK